MAALTDHTIPVVVQRATANHVLLQQYLDHSADSIIAHTLTGLDMSAATNQHILTTAKRSVSILLQRELYFQAIAIADSNTGFEQLHQDIQTAVSNFNELPLSQLATAITTDKSGNNTDH